MRSDLGSMSLWWSDRLFILNAVKNLQAIETGTLINHCSKRKWVGKSRR